MKRMNTILVIGGFILNCLHISLAQELPNPQTKPTATLLNINQISLWVVYEGNTRPNPETADWGIFYPRGTAGVVYLDGIVYGGLVNDGLTPELRVCGQLYRVGTSPGAIISRGVPEDPQSQDVRIWRIRKDWQTADLTGDAAEYFHVDPGNVTQSQIDQIRNQYQTDWQEWPWQKGAPFYDLNQNGILDDNEDPGLAAADQVVWFVVNDLDSNRTKNFLGSPPIGMEMQITLWAYNRSGTLLEEALQHVVFKRVRLIYKGHSSTPEDARIDSMFITQYAETDIGTYSDDFAGSDSLLQLGYGYNSSDDDQAYQAFQLAPPAFGYALVQGPIVPGMDGHDRVLSMSSFASDAAGDIFSSPTYGSYEGTLEMYNIMNGMYPRPITPPLPQKDPEGKIIHFDVSGDPITQTGFVDGQLDSPGNRQIYMNLGPFSMALGDTQEVVFALVGGLGEDHLTSVSVMKEHVLFAHQLANSHFNMDIATSVLSSEKGVPIEFHLSQNFPNPVARFTRIDYALPDPETAKLTIFNLLGEKVITLVHRRQEGKSFSVYWDGRDRNGLRVPPGLYFYRLEAGHMVQSRKMVVLKLK